MRMLSAFAAKRNVCASSSSICLRAPRFRRNGFQILAHGFKRHAGRRQAGNGDQRLNVFVSVGTMARTWVACDRVNDADLLVVAQSGFGKSKIMDASRIVCHVVVLHTLH